jgi:DNA modification methylase
LCWNKAFRKIGFRKTVDLDEFELAWTNLDIKCKIINYSWLGNISGFDGKLRTDYKNYFGRNHPTEKPLEIFKMCLQDYSKEGDTIFDPFLGSGTTARACKDLNRRFVGFEVSEKYCKIGEERLRQQNLF